MTRLLNVSMLALVVATTGPAAHAAVGGSGLAVPANEGKMNGAMTSPVGVMVGSALDSVRVYPNPWRADKHKGISITFDHVPPAATIKIFTLSGRFIKILDADDNGVATWDLANDSSAQVASGLYFYLISSDDGQDIKGKLAIIR